MLLSLSIISYETRDLKIMINIIVSFKTPKSALDLKELQAELEIKCRAASHLASELLTKESQVKLAREDCKFLSEKCKLLGNDLCESNSMLEKSASQVNELQIQLNQKIRMVPGRVK